MIPQLLLSSLMSGWFCPPPAQSLPPVPPAPQVVRWPGGSVVVNGPEVIVRQPGTGTGSTTVVTNSGNGFGNRIVVDNGGGGGVTVLQNVRNGFGNRIVLDPDEEVIELPPVAAPVRPTVYRGKAAAFWSEKVWSDAFDCHLYWSPADRAWYRYDRNSDTYRPVGGRP